MRERAAAPILLRVAVLALLAMLLGACASSGRTQSGLIKRINPPSASIESLAIRSGGPAQVAVRLQNFSTVPTRYGVLDAEVVLDGRPAGRLRLEAGIEIPGLTSDVVQAELALAPDARARLAAADAAVPYRLQGVIATTEPEDDYEFTFESRLNPVPGRPGEFR